VAAATAWTNAVVAICVVLVDEEAVGAAGVPVKVGEARGALLTTSLIWDWVTVTAPVMLGKVVLTVLLIRRIWSSAWDTESELCGLDTTRSEIKLPVSRAILLPYAFMM
jgi:hypothetical protein